MICFLFNCLVFGYVHTFHFKSACLFSTKRSCKSRLVEQFKILSKLAKIFFSFFFFHPQEEGRKKNRGADDEERRVQSDIRNTTPSPGL